MTDQTPIDLRQRLIWLPIAAFLFVARHIPFRARVALGGWLTAAALRAIPSQRRRVLDNLARVWPDMPPRTARALLPRIGQTMGRTTTEILFCEDHKRHHLPFRVKGPGLDLIRQAAAAGRAVILVTGHFGQWEAARLHLQALGLPAGGLYRPHNNVPFNTYFVDGLRAAGEPVLPRGKSGFRAMVRHVKSGGRFVILADQYHYLGVPLPFLGVSALTPLSAAEVALRNDALMIPFFALRRDGEGVFDLVYQDPIPHGDPAEMMRMFNDRLSEQVRAHPDQWLWTHRRWK